EQEGAQAVFSIRAVPKATAKREGGLDLGHKADDECYEQSRAGTAPPPPPPPPLPPSCQEPQRPDIATKKSEVPCGPHQEPDAKTSQRTESELPCEGDVLSLEERKMFHDMKIIPEPPGLLTFDSFKFNPTRADVNPNHPLPPCAPTHRYYIKHLTNNLRDFQRYPLVFQDLTTQRRAKFDKKMRRDGQIAEMRGLARQEILAAEATLMKCVSVRSRYSYREGLVVNTLAA
ncbi:unnamed protein product, partial [Polarella glacialis]